ncbi:SRPBCC domain-containing protein [bacterium]|nr:SRPBCC domain-containing protein [bacterium]
MTTITDTSLSITRIIPASPTAVFDAWTKPELMSKWCAPEGMDKIECTSDLKVGGSYKLVMTNPDGGVHTAFGTYTLIDPPFRLGYTWDWQEEAFKMGAPTQVNVEFRAVGEATEVTISQDFFPSREASEAHETGWSSCLNRLEMLFG